MSKLYKRVDIEVLSKGGKSVVARRRIVPDPGSRFTRSGVDSILEAFIGEFDSKNPGHKYRLVETTDKFKLVWDADREETPTAA